MLQEQRSHGAAVEVGVGAADRDDAELCGIDQRHGGGRAHLARVREQVVQFVPAQGAARGLAASQQGSDFDPCPLGTFGPHAGRSGMAVAEQNDTGVLDLEILGHRAVEGGAEFSQVIGFQQRQHQAPGLFVQLVVVAGVGGQRIETLTHFDIALAQDADLFLHQRYRTAGRVGDMQEVQHVRMALQEVTVVLQVLPDLFVGECALSRACKLVGSGCHDAVFSLLTRPLRGFRF